MGFSKIERRRKIRTAIRSKISGTPERPRLAVYRSNKEIYAQIVDDINGKTLTSVASLGEGITSEGTKKEVAQRVGKAIASKAKELGISNVVFDRGGYLYHGRVKELAEAARTEGLQF